MMRKKLGLIVTEELKLTATEIAGQKLIRGHILPCSPQSWDWRNVGGMNYTTPIQDQGDCGSCVAFGSCAVFESTKMIADASPQEADVKRSEWDLFTQIGTCDSGASLENANRVLQSRGVCAERCYPYDADSPSPCCGQTRLKLLSSVRITSDAIAKAWLSTNGPIQGAFDVPESFFDYTGGVYKDDGTNIAGSHATCIIGYDETKGAWLCKNSWGTQWGDPNDPGWFWIAYGNCNLLRGYAAYGYTFTPPTPTALTLQITPKNTTVIAYQPLHLNATITGGKPPYQTGLWSGDSGHLNSNSILNPVFTAPVGQYSLSLTVMDQTGASATDSTTITVTSTPPVAPDITLKKAGSIVVNVMYVGKKAANAMLYINKKRGVIQRGSIQMGKFAAGDTLGFALLVNGQMVQQNDIDDLSWGGVWFVKMSATPGTDEMDALLYIKESATKMSEKYGDAEELEGLLGVMIQGAMLIGAAKQSILSGIDEMRKELEGDE